jgi:hypothetical protein
VAGVHLWNYGPSNSAGNRCLQSFTLSFSTDNGSTYGNPVNLTGFTQYNSVASVPAETKTFDPVPGVTHIRMDNVVNHGDIYYAFSEIRFGVGSVASPGTLIYGK